MTSSTITGPNLIMQSSITINNSSTFPTANGQFARNGNVLAVSGPEFSIRRTATGTNLPTLSLVKVLSTPLGGEGIANIDFSIDDDGTILSYARMQAIASDITDAGLWKIQLRSDGTLQDAFTIVGDDNDSQFQYLTSSNGNTRIQPTSGSARLGYFVTPQVTDFSLNLGQSGSLQIPTLANENPSLSDLSQAFGAFDGAFGYESVDGKLYVRKSAAEWVFFEKTGSVT